MVSWVVYIFLVSHCREIVYFETHDSILLFWAPSRINFLCSLTHARSADRWRYWKFVLSWVCGSKRICGAAIFSRFLLWLYDCCPIQFAVIWFYVWFRWKITIHLSRLLSRLLKGNYYLQFALLLVFFISTVRVISFIPDFIFYCRAWKSQLFDDFGNWIDHGSARISYQSCVV